MAVPAAVTTTDMSGTYVLSKTLSDSSQAMLKMQGVGWVVRQAVQFSTVVTTLKQYEDSNGKHLDQEQISTPGSIKNSEERTFDWQWHESQNRIWGKVRARTRLSKVSDLTEDYLKEGWAEDCVDVVETIGESLADTWTAFQAWGFADVNGERKHVRRVVGTKGTQVEKIRLVYDWKVEAAATKS